MFSSLVSVVVLGGLSGLVAAAPNPTPVPQALQSGCHADNCLRAMRNPTRSATAASFCRTYIGVPAVETVTVGTVLSTVRLTSTVTSDTTATYTRVSTATDVSVVHVDTTATVVVTSTTTRALARRTDVAVPDFLTQYPAYRLSSACSCLDLPRATESVTFTAPAVTVVDVATVSVTASVDVVETTRTTTTTSITNPPSTVTVQAVATVTPPGFLLKGSGGGTSISGRFLKPVVAANGVARTLVFTTTRAEAGVFTLDATTTSGPLVLTDRSAAAEQLHCVLGFEAASGAPEYGYALKCVPRDARDACLAARTCLVPRFSSPSGVGGSLVPANAGGAGGLDASYNTLRGCPDGAAYYLAHTPATPLVSATRPGCLVIGLVSEAAV